MGPRPPIHIMAWNCRGLGTPITVNALRGVIATENPQVVLLSETKQIGKETKGIKQKLRFHGIIGTNSISTEGVWHFTGLYGHPEEEKNKHKTGNLFKNLKEEDNTPWLVGGDFNLLLMSNEKKGGKGFKIQEANIFRDAMEKCVFLNMGFTGHDYIWSNNRGGEGNIQERLDLLLANEKWRKIYQSSYVTHLSKRRSDHLPLLLTIVRGLEVQREKKKRRLFWIEEMWLKDESSEEVIRNALLHGGNIKRKLSCTAANLSSWSRSTLVNFAKEMCECRNQM
ncbi:putative membrane protein YozB [Bienertia sinuspersici]